MKTIPLKAPGSAAPQCGTNKGWYSRGYLPHLDASNIIQHITYRLADALPSDVLERQRREVESMFPDNERQKIELRRKIEAYLDAGFGSCILREPEVAACIMETWFRFDGERYRLIDWVVMPNHCHVLIEPVENIPLAKIILSWKNYTSRFINTYKRRKEEPKRTQRAPRVWQRDYWDRFIRDEHHFAAVKDYIVKNPVKAGLVIKAENWEWSSARWRNQHGE